MGALLWLDPRRGSDNKTRQDKTCIRKWYKHDFFFLQGQRLQSWVHFDIVFLNQTFEMWDLHLDPGLPGVMPLERYRNRQLSYPDCSPRSCSWTCRNPQASTPPASAPKTPRETCQNTKTTQVNIPSMGRVGAVGLVQSVRQASQHILPEGSCSLSGGQQLCRGIAVTAWGTDPWHRAISKTTHKAAGATFRVRLSKRISVCHHLMN